MNIDKVLADLKEKKGTRETQAMALSTLLKIVQIQNHMLLNFEKRLKELEGNENNNNS